MLGRMDRDGRTDVKGKLHQQWIIVSSQIPWDEPIAQ
jgi:hypothetical protein